VHNGKKTDAPKRDQGHGGTEGPITTMAEEPLNIQFNASDIDDLKKRLQQRRSFQRQECQPWQQGCEEAALNELLE
jgi:hypothetical protein